MVVAAAINIIDPFGDGAYIIIDPFGDGAYIIIDPFGDGAYIIIDPFGDGRLLASWCQEATLPPTCHFTDHPFRHSTISTCYSGERSTQFS
jgi:hypothetical protein